MSASFYLFDVDHGQAAALQLPNGRWCVFDAGCSETFSPIQWIATRSSLTLLAMVVGGAPQFRFLKGTVSHLHGDHFADYENLFQHGPEFIRTVRPDAEHLVDCATTCAGPSSRAALRGFIDKHATQFSPAVTVPNYGEVRIQEQWLPVAAARAIGGDANARVNNASIVTRVDVCGHSILLCGDLQKEAWEEVLGERSIYASSWRPLVSNLDILVAPHHGHRSGYSVDLLNLARPAVVLVSVVSRDPNVDTRYSQPPVRGITIDGTRYNYISTRDSGHIKIEFVPPVPGVREGRPGRRWTFADSALS